VGGMTNEAQVIANQGDINGMFSSTRRLTNNARPATVQIRDKEGKTATSTEGQIRRLKVFPEETAYFVHVICSPAYFAHPNF
jgi:hypothetical protein